jgi:hypothetical protein
MKKNKVILILLIAIGFANCAEEKHKFPIEKRFWDLNDYDKAILDLRFGYLNDEKKPTFDDPEQRIIVKKLTDEQNFKVVLDDTELGLKHKNKVATEFFSHWKDMSSIYQERDRKDMYVYGKEMLAVWQFGLGLQLRYFKLGNDEIIEGSDDPNSKEIRNLVNSNVNTLTTNYTYYLSLVNEEKSLTKKEQDIYANGISKYFTDLVELYPNAKYDSLKEKASLMLNKTESNSIKSALTKLIALIDSKKVKKE